MNKWKIAIYSSLLISAFLYLCIYSRAEMQLTPQQIEQKIMDRVYPTDSCVQMAIDAKKLAEENGYIAVYRSSSMRTEWNKGIKKHRWLAIYTPEQYTARKAGMVVQPVEILKTYDGFRDAKKRLEEMQKKR
jgi:hypothetical protein